MANAFKYGGKLCGILALIFDFFKGVLPVYIATRYLDTTNLFNYIYDNYTFSEVLSKYSVIDTIHIGEKQEELNLLLENNIIAFVNPQDSELVENKQIMLTKDLSEPIHAGEIIGSVTYTIDGIDYTENIISDKDIRY